MKKITFLILLLCAPLIAQDEHSLFANAIFFYREKDYRESEKYFSELIKEYNNSKQIEDYYYYDNEVLIKIAKTDTTGRSAYRPPSKTYPHGTLDVTFLEPDGHINPEAPKRIVLAEKYLSDTTFTKYRENFLWSLLWLYTKEKKAKHIKVAEELSMYDNLREQVDSKRILALYAYVDRVYEKAIELYKQIIAIDSTEHRERASFCLLLADCYFQIDKIDETMKYLKYAKEFEKGDKWKASTDMAQRWEKKISKYLREKPRVQKPILVIVD